MKLVLQKKKTAVVILLAGFIGAFTTCISTQDKSLIINSKGESFAGSERCASCHKEIFEGFIHTAHNITSQEASAETIKGSFTKAKMYIITPTIVEWQWKKRTAVFTRLSFIEIKKEGDSI